MPSHQSDPAPARALRNNAAAAALVGGLGLTLIVMVVTGHINNYLQPSFAPWALLTGAFLVGLSVWTLLSLRAHTHVLTKESPMRATSWILAVPLLIAVVFAPASLGASMINSTSIGSSEHLADPTDPNATPKQVVSAEHAANPSLCRMGRPEGEYVDYPALDEGAASDLTLADLADRFSCGEKAQLNGKQVRVTGFLSQGADGQWQLNRYRIYCCAAHALPYSVLLVGEIPGAAEDQWYEITGTVDTESGDLIPDLIIQQATPIEQPEVPYV